MKIKNVPLILALVLGTCAVSAKDAVISDAMKKYHKPEDALSKKIGKGEASAAELDTLLKVYEAMEKATPPKGNAAAWKDKCEDVISAIKKMKSKDDSGIADFKKAINCKACHDVYRGK